MIQLIPIIKRTSRLLFTLVILSVIVFYMGKLAPGNPLMAYYGDGYERMNTVEKQQAMTRLGLDEPLHIQYAKWLKAASQGDFGISYKYKEPVTTVIQKTYKNTLVLGGLAFIMTFFFALLMGIFCAMHEGRWIDKAICKIGVIGNSIPTFWVALIMILLFSVNLRWLPSSGAYAIGKSADFTSRMRHLVLPITVLVSSHLWYYAYMVRNKLVDEMRQDYVLFCIVKGLSKRQIVYKHCLRNIMPTYLSVMAISIPHLLGGTYIIESVFSYPGLGQLSFESAKYHDYNTLMVLSLLTGALVILSNVLVEYINERIDPRMRCKGGES